MWFSWLPEKFSKNPAKAHYSIYVIQLVSLYFRKLGVPTLRVDPEDAQEDPDVKPGVLHVSKYNREYLKADWDLPTASTHSTQVTQLFLSLHVWIAESSSLSQQAEKAATHAVNQSLLLTIAIPDH